MEIFLLVINNCESIGLGGHDEIKVVLKSGFGISIQGAIVNLKIVFNLIMN